MVSFQTISVRGITVS